MERSLDPVPSPERDTVRVRNGANQRGYCAGCIGYGRVQLRSPGGQGLELQGCTLHLDELLVDLGEKLLAVLRILWRGHLESLLVQRESVVEKGDNSSDFVGCCPSCFGLLNRLQSLIEALLKVG